MEYTGLPTSGSLEDENAKALTYRVRGVPNGLDRAGAKSLLLAALETQDLTIHSMAAAKSKQVATIRIPGKPLKLKGWGTSRRQWQVSARGVSMTVDTHFGGFTPLHDSEGDAEHMFDCVVISGLGSHAFGSWKDRDSDHMWIRDTLPEELPGARVMIYGYDSKLAKSTSFQSLGDVASRFRDSLQITLGKRTSGRPLIFIAHSLGGLVLKQAMIQMESGDAADLDNLKATFAIFFFGVPNQGMDIKSLLAMVHGQPNLPFLAALDKNNGLLHELVEKFRAVFDFRDSHVISFFETEESPTARLDEGKWSMTGDSAILVDRYSAKSGRSWEDKPSHLHPINCSHSEMVKFPEHDEDCEVVMGKLKRFAELAPAVIRARWKDNTEAKAASFSKPAFAKSTPNLALTPSVSNLHLLGSSPALAKSTDKANSSISMGPHSKKGRLNQAPMKQDEASQMTDLGDKGGVTPQPKFEFPSTKASVDPYIDIPSSPPPPVYNQHIASCENQEQYGEARLIFNKTIGDNYRHGRTGYLRVGVLFLTWEDDDMQCKATEVDKLNCLLREDFHFQTEYFEIPSERSRTDLLLKVSSFMSSYDDPECLAIIYYGGHGYLEEKTKKFKLAAKSFGIGATAFFADIDLCLRVASCDQLLILDCAFSGQAFAAEEMGKRRFEILTSTTHDSASPAPGRGDTFTLILTDAMKRLHKQYPNGFSLNLTFTIDTRPDLATMNDLAMSLRFLPHVEKISFEKLYSPRD